MTAQPRDEETPFEVAAGWLARQRSGAMSAQETEDFRDWLERDPGHREALDHVQEIWRASAGLRTDPQVMALRDAAMNAHQGGGRSRFALGAIAAALAIAMLGGWWLWIGAPREQVFSTGVGQTATVTLQDGSVVTLDTDTKLRARQTPERRMVQLDRGQAFFRVAKDPARPFTVAAGDKTITAVGTAFNVRLLPARRVEVVLAEGRVKVASTRPERRDPQAPARVPVADMAPGSRLVTVGADDWRIARVDVEEATSWRTGQLTFVRRPLGAVADELNRYSEKKIVIRDDALASAPITGGFAAGDVDSFVAAIREYGLADVASDTDAVVVLRTP